MHIHKVGEVLGAAKVPSRDSLSTWLKRLIVSRTWVGQIVVDQHTKGRLKLLVLFNPGLAHVVAPLFVHRQVVRAKESFPLLKAGWSAALRPRSASQQAAQFPPARGNQRRLWFENFTDLG